MQVLLDRYPLAAGEFVQKFCWALALLQFKREAGLHQRQVVTAGNQLSTLRRAQPILSSAVVQYLSKQR